MTAMPTVLESAKNNWNKAPDSLKRDVYDSNYLKAFTECLRKFNASTAKPQVHQVIDWLVEGVAAISPHYSYVPGDCQSLLSRWAIRRMPVTLADYCIRKWATFDWDLEQYLKNKPLDKKKK